MKCVSGPGNLDGAAQHPGCLNLGTLQNTGKFKNQTRFAPHTNLSTHIAQMSTDGIVRNVKLTADLIIIEAGTYQLRDFHLLWRQMPALAQIVPLP